MTEWKTDEPPRRVLVALDAEETVSPLLEAAANLAAGMQAELAGIFVEDSELLEAASLSVTRTISSCAEAQTELDARSMRRALRITADRAGAALAAVARRHRLKFSYRVVRGAMVEQVLQEASRSDLVALGPSGRTIHRASRGVTGRAVAERAPCPVLLLQAAAGDGAVVVVFDGAAPALALGAQLARITERPLLVLAIDGTEAGVAELVDRAEDWIGNHYARGRVFGAVAENTGDIRALLDAQHPGMLVLDPESGLVRRLGIDAILAGLKCSVFVLR